LARLPDAPAPAVLLLTRWMGCYPRSGQMEQHLDVPLLAVVTKPPTLGFAMFSLRT